MKIELPEPAKDFPHKPTPEECSRGAKSISPYRMLALSLHGRKKCSVKCRFFEQCPVNALSLGFIDPKTHEKGKCLMKEFPEQVRQQFINLFLTGEEGIIKAIKEALHNYMNDVNAYGSLRDKRDMVDLMLRFYKEIYNSPKRNMVTKEPLLITIRRVGMEPQGIVINPRKALPDGVTMDDLLTGANGDITECDPESLFAGEKIDEIVSKPRVYMEEIKIESNIERIMEEDDEG